MKTFSSIFCALFILMGINSTGFAQSAYSEGLYSAIKSHGLGKLVNEAKRSDPNSGLPSAIEHMLAGLSMVTDPTVTIQAIYPGSFAAHAIGQLIDRHGKDIANMTYRDRKVFIGNEYGDPSLIPNGYYREVDQSDTLCREMFDTEYGGVRDCKKYVSKIQQCSANKKPSEMEIKHCTEYVAEFYDHMKLYGKTKLVKQAGEVASKEFREAVIAGFTGYWDTNWGMMKINEDGSGGYTHDKGKITGSVSGKTYKGTWSEAPSYKAPEDAGDVELILSVDGKTFKGKWRKGSKGDWKHDWNGKRVYKGGNN